MNTWTRALRRRYVLTRGAIGGAIAGALALAGTWWIGGASDAAIALAVALVGGLAAAGAADTDWARRERARAVEVLRAHRLRRAQLARRRRRMAASLTRATSSSNAA